MTIQEFVQELPLNLLRALASEEVDWATADQMNAAHTELARRETARAAARTFAKSGGRRTLPGTTIR